VAPLSIKFQLNVLAGNFSSLKARCADILTLC